MNVLRGNIEEIITEKDISLVRVRVEQQLFSSIVIDKPDTSPYLVKDHAVRLLFKETEVVIAKGVPAEWAISMQNKFECTITGIRTGKILCELILAWQSRPEQAPVEIRSVITRNACEQLRLKTGDLVLALIKTNEISLSSND
jgi:molybdate transport system regulatory protein